MTCKYCKGIGYIRKTVDGYDTISPCSCTQLRQLNQHFENAGIPTRYRNWTLQSEKPKGTGAYIIPFEHKKWILKKPEDDRRQHFKAWSGPENESSETFHSQFQALKHCRALLKTYINHFHGIKRDPNLPGLLMMGTVGIGKTHLLCTLLTDLIYAGINNVFFIEMTDLMKKLQFSYNRASSLTEESILLPLVNSDVLVLDDLGSFGSDNQNWILNTLGFVLNKRYSFNKPTLISTNYFDDPDEKNEKTLQDCLGTRLRSRIRETCPELIMKGYDYREYGSK